jgi:hypothetical protein
MAEKKPTNLLFEKSVLPVWKRSAISDTLFSTGRAAEK